jgi:hypothetical protein
VIGKLFTEWFCVDLIDLLRCVMFLNGVMICAQRGLEGFVVEQHFSFCVCFEYYVLNGILEATFNISPLFLFE